MTYRVIIQPPAAIEIEDAYSRIAADAPMAAARWYNGLLDAIESLSSHPRRCSLAPEDSAFELEIRQLLYGRKGRMYRALLTVAGDTVHVLHFRHWAQAALRTDEIERPSDPTRYQTYERALETTAAKELLDWDRDDR